MAQCTQCGEEPAKNIHLDYPGDRLCNVCYVALCEERYDETLDILREAVRDTGERSYVLEDLDSDA